MGISPYTGCLARCEAAGEVREKESAVGRPRKDWSLKLAGSSLDTLQEDVRQYVETSMCSRSFGLIAVFLNQLRSLSKRKRSCWRLDPETSFLELWGPAVVGESRFDPF